jgi:hypothetical protein
VSGTPAPGLGIIFIADPPFPAHRYRGYASRVGYYLSRLSALGLSWALTQLVIPITAAQTTAP